MSCHRCYNFHSLTNGLLVLLLAVCASFALSSNVPPHITTSAAPPQVVMDACDATVVGTWTVVNSSVTTANVRQFQGIPFAQAPIGTLRFSPPTELSCPAKSGTVFEATSFSQPCLQGDVGDEDCLYLNVYVPEVLNTTLTQRAPVLVYIHGGGLTGGSGIWEPLQYLSAFAGGDDSVSSADGAAVVVTINYRLGVLGFLAVKELCEVHHNRCGNYGIMDQIAALKWVRTNIASFGGDPNRVNIMGQSSGGTSVFALMGAPSASGLFQSGISLSGSPNITMDKPTKLDQDASIVVSLGCEGVSSEQVVGCLRSLNATAIQAAMPNSWNTPALFSNRFLNNASAVGEGYAALVFVDGELIPKPVWTSLAEGLNQNVTLVFGNMGQERNLVTPTVPVANMTLSQYHQYMKSSIMETWPHAANVTDRLSQFYKSASAVSPQMAYDSFNADYGLSCATFSLASLLREAFPAASSPRPAPMYSYIHQWGPSNITLDPSQGNVMQYAFHTWDYVNAVHNWADFYTPVSEDFVLSRLQRSQWFQVWKQKYISSGMEWPSLLIADTPLLFLFSLTSRYPYRQTGATEDPYTSPGICDYIVNELGMNQRYWWCN